MSKKSSERNPGTLNLLPVENHLVDFFILGKTPFICNAMSEKARHELLAPRGRLSTLEKQTNLKHDPLQEYRDSPYTYADDKHPTRIYFPAGGFKKAMMTATLEMEGATKASIARLLWVEETNIDLYGIPALLMSVTRSADMNHTPDIRTRAILNNWAVKLSVRFVVPKLNQQAVGNIMAGAGMMVGVGDYRQEKGAGNFGQFEIVVESDKKWQTIVKNCGRKEQDQALAAPSFHDLESEKLYHWYEDEMRRRAAIGKATTSKGRKGSGEEEAA